MREIHVYGFPKTASTTTTQKRVDFYIVDYSRWEKKALRKPWLPDFVCHIGFGTPQRVSSPDGQVGTQCGEFPGSIPVFALF